MVSHPVLKLVEKDGVNGWYICLFMIEKVLMMKQK